MNNEIKKKIVKNTKVYTPASISEFIYNILKDKIDKKVHYIIDPCSGKGSLIKPWKENGWDTLSIDNDENLELGTEVDWPLDFFSLDKEKCDLPPSRGSLILCNPPFNGMKPHLAPQVWLEKIVELFGKEIPIILFAPLRMRLCSTYENQRYQKWIRGEYPRITSIISIPSRNTFENIDFFCEILIFNIDGLEPHYFYKRAMKISYDNDWSRLKEKWVKKEIIKQKNNNINNFHVREYK